MKHLEDQIKFIDTKLLPLYGFKNILDYSHIICINNLDDFNIDLGKLNGLIDEFRKIFNSKNFSLHKTQYKILTKSQSICLLKTCLEITSIPHDVKLIKNKKHLRLISKNNALDNYINTIKMTENSNFSHLKIEEELEKIIFSNIEPIKNLKLNPNNDSKNPNELCLLNENNNNQNKLFEKFETITKKQLNEGIKKIYQNEFYLNPKLLLTECEFGTNTNNEQTHDIIRIDLKKYNLEQSILKSLKVEFISKKINSCQIISTPAIEHFAKNLKYKIINVDLGIVYWGGKITDSNYIVDNLLCPIKLLSVHCVYLDIVNIQEIMDIINNLEIKVIIETVDLYAELDNKLKNAMLEQEICIGNKYNLLRIYQGMIGLGYSHYMDKKDIIPVKTCDLNENSNDYQLEKVGKKITIGNIDGCLIEDIKKFDTINIMKFFEVNKGINHISIDKIYKITNELSYHKMICNDKSIHIYSILFKTNNSVNKGNLDLITLTKLEFLIPNVNKNINDKQISKIVIKYKSEGYNRISKKNDTFDLVENANLQTIKNNTLKLYWDFFIPFNPSNTNFTLEFETLCPEEPVQHDIVILARLHTFSQSYVEKMKIEKFQNISA